MKLLDIRVEHESYEVVLVSQSVTLMHCKLFFSELAYAIPRFLNDKVVSATSQFSVGRTKYTCKL